MKSSRRKRGVLKGFRRPQSGTIPTVRDCAIPDPSVKISSQCRITWMDYSRDSVNETEIHLARDLFRTRGAKDVHWIRVEGRADDDTIQYVGQAFNLHPLAMEDVVNDHQRCKVEDYPDHLFVVIRQPVAEREGGLGTEQICLFIGRDFLVTVHTESMSHVRDRVLLARGRVRELKADYLAYLILDYIIDSYFPVVEQLGDRLNAVDEFLEKEFDPGHRIEIRDVRSDLLLLRRTIWPQREAVAALLRDETGLISDSTKTYLRDCYDHTVQLMDVVETYRELCADLRDFYVAELGIRNNEIMKTLTVIATLFMPLSFVAGFYGMNFHFMPELTWRFGYPLAISAMIVIAVCLLAWFRKKEWI
ncbi:MAG: magnesium/cobalt transporter CorA [Planctomycetaceae bacterium]|nr:magnesium/cobalt transporter CorA [Planctomycetaceae bacterium]